MARIMLEATHEKSGKYKKIDIEEEDVFIFEHHTTGKYIFKLGMDYYKLEKSYYIKDEDGKRVDLGWYDPKKSGAKRASEEDKRALGGRKAYSPIAKANDRAIARFSSSIKA